VPSPKLVFVTFNLHSREKCLEYEQVDTVSESDKCPEKGELVHGAGCGRGLEKVKLCLEKLLSVATCAAKGHNET